MGMQPILPIIVPVKKIKGAAHKRYGDGDGVVQCGQTINMKDALNLNGPLNLNDH